MIYLCSPTKTTRLGSPGEGEILFPRQSDAVLRAYQALSEEERNHLLHITGEPALRAKGQLEAFGVGPGTKAVEAFSGLQFQYLDWEHLDQDARHFLASRLYIVSAVYGLIPAESSIHPLRLDMNDRLTIQGEKLERFWRCPLDSWARERDEPILLLTSAEYGAVFSKDVREKMVEVSFGERVQSPEGARVRTKATYAKMGRGAMLHAIAKGRIDRVEDLKSLKILDMVYDEELSTDNHLCFTKEKSC